MRRLTALIVLGVLSLNLFLSSGYVVHYYVQLDQYLEQCENKDRPELQCEGKCVLMQKIKAAEKQERQERMAFTFYFEFFNQDFSYQLSNESTELTKAVFFWEDTYSFDQSSSFFVPPRYAA